MRRPAFTLIVALISMLLAVVPATAITNGELDNGRHPNVGAYFFTVDGTDIWSQMCNGTLISPSIFLTNAGCACFSVAVLQIPGLHFWITFHPDVVAAHSNCTSPAACPDALEVAAENIHIQPEFGCSRIGNVGRSPGTSDVPSGADLAVITLPRPVEGVTPATLPPLGFLEDQQAQNGLRGQTFTVVGYGWQVEFGQGMPVAWVDGKRRLATSEYLALAPGALITSQNSQLGNGGACWRDPGGPFFFGDTNMVVALAYHRDTNCRAMNESFRLDIDLARGFLADYVTLP